eukprot:jgi/Chlat1/1770/Chrsp134S00111
MCAASPPPPPPSTSPPAAVSLIDAPPHADTAPAASNASSVPTFQEAIQRLQEYWSRIGCAVLTPYNTEVGAGTMNPATFLRVLGPEPWNVAYIEPSVRPDDSRYGDNPNRVQQHTQFQVILKPDPGNPQELYLGSLAALGIDTRKHDVRFVEDNWESPVLGAWGLGWEVWMDGMEITQFTYFQQCGSLPLKPVAVEITYGLERIIMALQGVDHFKKIRYTNSLTYGELFLQNEREMSTYNLDAADLGRTQQRFDLYDEEARAMLTQRLPIPAFNHLLKSSHVFNILDARGAVGVTERARFFSRMRSLARQCAQLWVEIREELGYPLGTVDPPQLPDMSKSVEAHSSDSSAPRAFVLEIGSEELPPQDVASALEQLRASVPAMLEKLRLLHSTVTCQGTPRRLAVMVQDLAGRQLDKEESVRGPPVKAAFAADGSPTKALLGFCAKNRVDAADVQRILDAKGVEYVFATVKQVGRPAHEILSEELPNLVSSLSFPKTMRWTSEAAYSRPLRWLVALHGDMLLDFQYALVRSNNGSRVLRNAEQPVVQVPSAEAYLETLRSAGIMLSVEERKEYIWSLAAGLAAEVGGRVPEEAKEGLLDEVANLVEAPAPLLGSFDASFLELPREVLVTVMRKHQRYFPVEDSKTGRLLPHFVTVANGILDEATVRAGNEAVLRARYEDARFFYNADVSKPLIEFRPLLNGITFQEKLGSMLNKTDRVEALLQPLAELLELPQETLQVAQQAGPLSRADLATAMVVEFTGLAGVMGRHYTLKSGASEEVATAVFESVLPRNAGDALPSSGGGALLAVADRLDSLVGLFAVGCGASATADPFGLRRAAYGLVQTLVQNTLNVDLRKAVDAAASVQPVEVSSQVREEVINFVTRRLEQLLSDSGLSLEVVRAVLSQRGHDPVLATASAKELESVAKSEPFQAVLAAYSRPTRIVRGKAIAADAKVDEKLFVQDEEQELWTAYQQAASKVTSGSTVEEFVSASQELLQPIAAFFDNVFVMAEDEAVRQNRLALLREVASLPVGILDFAELPGF